MDRNSKLIPSQTRELCAEVQSNLSNDNMEYYSLKQAIQFFQIDGRLKGTAYDSLKSHLSDYELVLDSLIKANDFISLKAGHMGILVGDEEFDGQVIFDRIDELSRKIENARQDASYWNHDHAGEENPGPNPYQSDVDDYTALRNLEYAKIERFDAIDAATSGLFTEAEETIKAANDYLVALTSRTSDGIKIDLGPGFFERNSLLSRYNNLSVEYNEEKGKKVSNNYADLRQEEIDKFWLTHEMFDDPYWYQDASRRDLVYALFREELAINGLYELNKPGPLSAEEKLIRERKMMILRYMANSLKGEATDRMLDDLETMCAAYGVDYYDGIGWSDEYGHVITPQLFEILVWNEERRIGREFGHACDQGWGDVIDGAMVFVDGATFDPAGLGNTPVEDLGQAIIQQGFDLENNMLYDDQGVEEVEKQEIPALIY